MNYAQEVEELILTVIKEQGSDIHITVGAFPTVRVNGELIPLLKRKEMTGEDTVGILRQMVSERVFTNFVVSQELDFSYDHKGEYRFRGNAFFQKGSVAIALRLIPRARNLADLKLPTQIQHIARSRQGFFLVVGPVGQGKSTTLAAMIDQINRESRKHIVTIEDPIEFVFEHDKSMIDQREVGIDTPDFPTALISAFRQDVDVILIGEMRDRNTIGTAVTAAETGHFVLSTLHTNSASQAVDRIIDSFPADAQDQIRVQLSSSLLGVFSQRLLPKVSGGMVPAYELLINNKAVSNLIRERRTHEIDVVIETGSADGMIDFNRCLADLVKNGEVLPDVALERSKNPSLLKRLF
jgi:twitching motility protein PilT